MHGNRPEAFEASYDMRLLFVICFLILSCCCSNGLHAQDSMTPAFIQKKVKTALAKDIIAAADSALLQSPITVTAFVAPRSAGGRHDFYSEGDYWWPNPASPDSPYIQKDGLTNPDNFVSHRIAMIRLSQLTGDLASAYLLTGDEKYVAAAIPHYKAWFADTATMMYPNLQYAQAIKGRFTGRGIGIIDGIQLMEVVKSLNSMASSSLLTDSLLASVTDWFRKLLAWLTTHPYGKDEMNAANNHGTCWVMQVAVFANFVGDDKLRKFCSDRFKQVLLPRQMAQDGSFPLELKRTKPYGYAIFNLDAMATICQVLSTPNNNLWTFKTPDGRSIRQAIAYMFPYIRNKSKWPLPPDVMHWNNWPVAQPFLLFGAAAYQNREWLNTWLQLEHHPRDPEVVRNLPVRHPLLWMSDSRLIKKL